MPVSSGVSGLARDPDRARYARLVWNTPLSDEHAGGLLHHLDVRSGHDILDLGCGWGELLLRAVAAGSIDPAAPCRGVGVDIDDSQLTRGRALAFERGLDAQVSFVGARAEAWQQRADRILCVGAAHAWGGAEAALKHLIALTRPGSRLLFGDGCWEHPPSEAALALFGADVLPLRDLVSHASTLGWRILDLSCADQREWDVFESGWLAGREEWLLANPEHPGAAAVRAELDGRLMEYLTVYRGHLGFCYLVLAR